MVTVMIKAVMTIAVATFITAFAAHIVGMRFVANASSAIRSGISTRVTYLIKLLKDLLGFPAPYTEPGFDIKLPAELRLQIYGYLLQSDFRLKRRFHTTWPSLPHTGTGADALVNTSILAVNKLIRHEATAFFYENNTFLHNLAYIAYVERCGTHLSVELKTQELDKSYQDIHISCNAIHRWPGFSDFDRALCVVQIMRYLFVTRNERPKLRSVLFQMGNQNTNLMAEVSKSFPDTKLVCTAVGRWELTHFFAGSPKFKLEYPAMAAVWDHYHALHPDDPSLCIEDTTVPQQLQRFTPDELDLLTRAVKSRLGPARVGWYATNPSKAQFNIMTIQEKSALGWFFLCERQMSSHRAARALGKGVLG